jgi:sulfate transport system ATP-binding protein
VSELVNLVKLSGYEKHYPDQLSGGQRQRVALARALATEPRVLLLDEPFGSLDAKVRDNLAQWLKEFHSKLGITSIFVTHDQAEAIEISDKIVVINRGRVEQMGSARKVYEYPESKFVASFIGQVNVLDAVVRDGKVLVKGTSHTVRDDKGEPLQDGDVVLLVRPENIELHAEAVPDALPCVIKKIHYRGSHYELDCALNGIVLNVIEHKRSFMHNKWREDQPAFTTFKSWRIFKAYEGHAEIHQRLKELGYIE